MKILRKCKDGGPLSTVDAYVLIEIKSLFSIMILKFNKGSRENFHSHAFNALSIYLSGHVTEKVLQDNQIVNIERKGFSIKTTPRHVLHKVFAHKNSWCLTCRGSWNETWQEYNLEKNQTDTLKHGRKIIKTER